MSETVKTQKKTSFYGLLDWLLHDGKDRIDFNNAGGVLNLPRGGVPTKARGAPPDRSSHLVVEKSTEAITPVCLILLFGQDNPAKENHTEAFFFRFTLNGALERVILTEYKKDAAGNSIHGSAVDTIKDINDPDIKKKAKEELDFWLKRAYSETHKKPAPKASPKT